MMLKWAFGFLAIGLIAALFGFTTIAGVALGFARILFFIFLALFVLLLFIGLIMRV